MEQIIERKLYTSLVSHLEEKEVSIIIGPRQVGKTTTLNWLIEYLEKRLMVKKEDIFYFNLDRIRDFEFFKSQEEVIKFLTSASSASSKGKIYLLVDEVQRLNNAGRFFKGIYDLGSQAKFILTGSSSLELKSKFQESLTGRKRLFYLWPFDFEEFVSFRNPRLKEMLKSENLSSYDLNSILDLLKEFLVFGGYPRQAIERNYEKKKFLIEEIYDSYVEKDIVNFLKIKNVFNFSKLVKILANHTGKILNINELSGVLETERKTVQHYLNILEETFVIKLVRPFFRNSLKELVKSPKVFFIDNGLRNSSIDNLNNFEKRLDNGEILENFVFMELFKKLGASSIYYWRTIGKQEVDFVVEKRNVVIPIEVKSNIGDAKIPSGLKSFINEYHPPKAFIVNLKIRGKVNFKGTEIEFIYPFVIAEKVSKNL